MQDMQTKLQTVDDICDSVRELDAILQWDGLSLVAGNTGRILCEVTPTNGSAFEYKRPGYSQHVCFVDVDKAKQFAKIDQIRAILREEMGYQYFQ